MKRILMLALAVIWLASACTPAKGIEVHSIWMRPAAQGDNGAVYFVIHNHSSKADELSSVSSAAAEAVEIHESQMNVDVMEMHQLASLPLEAYAEVKFEPGSYHLMLVGLKQDLQVGDRIEITLHFQSAEDMTLSVPVRDTAAPEEDHSSTDHS